MLWKLLTESVSTADNHGGHQISGGIMPNIATISTRAAQGFLLAAVFAASYIPAHVTYEANNSPESNASIPLHLQSDKTLSWQDEINLYADRLMEAYGIDNEKAVKFSEWILTASWENDVPSDLISSVIMTESSFRTNVTSTAGAVGPAQVKPKYWSDSCGDLNNPLDNIRCGAMVLKKYSDQANGDVKAALKMYNVGPTNYRKKRMTAASDRYITKIVRHLAMLENPTVVIQ